MKKKENETINWCALFFVVFFICIVEGAIIFAFAYTPILEKEIKQEIIENAKKTEWTKIWSVLKEAKKQQKENWEYFKLKKQNIFELIENAKKQKANPFMLGEYQKVCWMQQIINTKNAPNNELYREPQIWIGTTNCEQLYLHCAMQDVPCYWKKMGSDEYGCFCYFELIPKNCEENYGCVRPTLIENETRKPN